MGALHSRAGELAGSLAGAGLTATTDIRRAVNKRPAVLVPPPAVDYTARLVTWRLVLLADSDVGDDKAWRDLDDLLTAVEAVLPVEQAEPGSYQLPAGSGACPAYIATTTTSL